MTNKKKVQFKQSYSDFPLTVSLGEKKPTWGLSRWKGERLHFTPTDDEGFTIRGDKQRLVYKGSRRTHRFTVIDDGSFEYDCILNREPESNVVSLCMEGAEHFDFFRQPNFIKDPFIAGSYAVYKKETIIGEGTGKLCHIHRPEIIDARGRRVWGEITVNGDCLCITIPEQWLSEAKYPVIVDPVVGTTTVGSQLTGTDPNNPYYDRPWLDNEFALNKFLIQYPGKGRCTGFVHCYKHPSFYNHAVPLLYTNNGNAPYKKKSLNEGNIDVIVTSPYYDSDWRGAYFDLDGVIMSGDYVWYGIWATDFAIRFDYGGDCYKGWFDWDTYIDVEGEPTPFMSGNEVVTYCNFKFSMYFTYSEAAKQVYQARLIQGVAISDTRQIEHEEVQPIIQTVSYTEGLTDRLVVNLLFLRQCVENVRADCLLSRINNLWALIHDFINQNDIMEFSIVFIRPLQETIGITSTIKQWKEIIRNLFDEVFSSTNTERQGTYPRSQKDTVIIEGPVIRSLFVFVRVMTTSFIRDLIFKHFLVAKEELVLKSCITKEIIIDSKIV